MIKKVFNWTVGSFFRTIGRTVAYIGIGAVIVILFGSCEVNAATLYNYTLPNQARMGNITSATAYDTNELSNLITATADNGIQYDYLGFNNKYTYATYGTYLQFCTDTYMQKSHTYTVNIAVATGIGSYTRHFQLGSNLGGLRVTSQIASAFYNFQPVNIIHSNVTYTEELFNIQDFQNLSIISVTFQPSNYEGKCLNFNINTSTSGQELLQFYGYSLTDNGIDYSGDFDNVNDNIDNATDSINDSITDSNNQINTNIDEMEDSINSNINENFNNCRDSNNILDIFNSQYNYKPGDIISSNGITFTIQEDGSVIINGSSSSYFDLPIFGRWGSSDYKMTVNDNLRLSLQSEKNVHSGVQLLVVKDGTTQIASTSDYYTASITEETNLTYVVLRVLANQQFDNLVVYPMLQEGTNEIEYEAYGEQICSNRLDNVSDSVNDLNDNITNNDTTGAEGEIGGFFDSFTTTDHGGISGIITAPLMAFNQMLSGTCNPMTTTYKNKTITLPCGTEFWNKLGEIRTFYNLVIGGLLSYRICKELFRIIENLKNPDDDRVEVLDL